MSRLFFFTIYLRHCDLIDFFFKNCFHLHSIFQNDIAFASDSFRRTTVFSFHSLCYFTRLFLTRSQLVFPFCMSNGSRNHWFNNTFWQSHTHEFYGRFSDALMISSEVRHGTFHRIGGTLFVEIIQFAKIGPDDLFAYWLVCLFIYFCWLNGKCMPKGANGRVGGQKQS